MVLAKGPGLYTDIGKKAKDLLYKDYLTDQKFTLTTYAANGLTFTSSGTRKGDLLLGDISTQLKNKNITTDVKVDTSSKLTAIITFEEPAPGLKAIFNVAVPEQSGKVELQYRHEYAGISTSLGTVAKPIANFSGVAGNQKVACGADVSFDTAIGHFTKYDASFNVTTSDLIASLALTEKGDSITTSYVHTVNPSTAVGAEFVHRFSTNENVLTIGTQHSLDPKTSVKARVNSNGKASALIQHQCCSKSVVTLSGEVETRSLEHSAQFGLAIAIKP